MTLAFDLPNIDLDPADILNGGNPNTYVYRVGDAAVLAGGAYIGAFNDDGEVFTARKYADDSGLGLGKLDTYHVHDNGDGTMNVYYQIRDADPLPTLITNWVVTLNAQTGEEIAPASQITTGAFSRNDQSMMEKGFDLPNGNIALIQAHATFTSAVLVIADADGNVIGESASVLGANVFGIYGMYDLAVVGDNLVVTWLDTDAGAARETFAQVFDMTGNAIGGPVTVSQGVSSGFGVPAGVQIETLSDGRYVIVWVEAIATGSDTDGTSTWFRIYNPDGSVSVDATLVNSNTDGNQDTPLLIATESGFIVGFTAFEFSPTFRHEGRLVEYNNDGVVLDTMSTGAYLPSAKNLVRTDNNTALLLTYEVQELILPGDDTPLPGQPSVIDGTRAAEVLNGTDGDDIITALGGADTINGNDGNDTIAGDHGNDTINGGIGADTITGGAGLDTISGGADDDTINGGAGSDVINGNSGHDILEGGGGNDTMSGGTGNDNMSGGFGSDVMSGDGGDDIMFGWAGHDTLNGGNGNDTLNGNRGGDTLSGDAGDDSLSGGSGNDDVSGGIGDDILNGGTGRDTLRGGDDNDLVKGNDGNDWLDGEAGNDILNGGLGLDDFVFADGADRIVDVEDNVDTIHLDSALWGGAALSISDVLDYATVIGGDTVFDFGNGNTLTIDNLADKTLLSNDLMIF